MGLVGRILLGFGYMFLASCSADDLGSQPSKHIAIDAEAPSWDGGIAELVQAKCANCHTADRTQFVPQNTPETYNRMVELEFFQTTAVLQRVLVRVEHPTTPMPPHFATPLYADEASALLTYARNHLEATPSQ